ncbi:aldose epimerase family protein [Chitinophaga sp. 30R24]|uniref:aldose epimerase family protein n=1 Tax=Chitinophaga sp. 30R24 TaxID=3248838 RepID=UPI003B90A72C
MQHRQDKISTVSYKQCGVIKGEPLYLITLKNQAITVNITNLGGTVMSVFAPDRNGIVKNITAGYKDADAYANNPWYFGCVAGRYANRIAGGKFLLNGQIMQLSVNNSGNHLHGGFEGLHKKVWTVTSLDKEDTENSVELEYLSEDGEEGYSGNLRVKVKYMLNQSNQLVIRYTAVTDKSTPVNLTNHSYFNLTGFGHATVADHFLYVNAGFYTEKNENNIPTGRILPVAGTPLDFSVPVKVGAHFDQFPLDMGFDHNYVLSHVVHGEMLLAAELEDKDSGRRLRVYTDQPGIQVYTANYWDGSITGQQGMPYVKHGAIALETQAFPDSPNHPGFPNTILEPGQHYHSSTVYEFGTT